MANAEMLAGYMDGLNGDPEPGPNRSRSYRHGWLNGRDDRRHQPRDTAANLRIAADAAERADAQINKAN